jgi:hypothetical protein
MSTPLKQYNNYKRNIRNVNRQRKEIAAALRKGIIAAAKDAPKGQKNILRKQLIQQNQNILNVPTLKSFRLSFADWQKDQMRLAKEADRAERIRKAKQKGIYGTDRKSKNMSKDFRKKVKWADRFVYTGKRKLEDKESTTMDEGIFYKCYLRWSDNIERDRFLKVLPNVIKDAKVRVDLTKNRRVRLLWEYVDDLENTKETKWASTRIYVDSWDYLMEAVKKVTAENSDIYEGLYSTVININFHVGGSIDNEDYGEYAARSIKTARKTFYEVSDKADYNCQYCAVYRAGANDWESEKVVRPASELKHKIDPDLKLGGNYQSLQLLADYKQYIIKVYNNLYQLIKTIYPVSKPDAKRKRKIKTIEIRINNHHWTALFRYSGTILTPPDTDLIEVEGPEDNLGDSEIIKASRSLFMVQKLDSRIATYDLETTRDANNKHVVYMAAVCIPIVELDETMEIYEKDTFYQQWVLGDDCPSPVMAMIEKMMEYTGFTFYAHNGGKFDLNFLLSELLPSSKYLIDGDTELNGRWLTLNIKHFADTRKKITMRDSWCLLQNPLNKCTSKFKVNHQKLVELVSHDDINLTNYTQHLDNLSKYLYHDVMGLLEVLFKFRNIVWSSTLKKLKKYQMKKGKRIYDEDDQPIHTVHHCGINITKCYTLASLAKKAFFRNFYDDRAFPIHTLSKKTDNYVRCSYAGGRVECHYGGEVRGKIYYLDFTSLFPAMMRNDLPYGSCRFVEGAAVRKLFEKDCFFGFIRCIVRQIRFDLLPLHCVKLNQKGEVSKTTGKLTFPIIETPTELTLFSEEIKMGIELEMYEYEFLDGVKFHKGKCMDKYITHLYKLKEDSSPNGIAPNPVLRQIAKIWICSGYGYWGLKAFDREGCCIEHESAASWKMKYEQNKLINCGKIGEYYVSRYVEDIKIKELNVGIASAITSYARMRLWSLMCDIKRAGGKVFYCDTDSVMTDMDVANHPTLQKEYVPDRTGAALGSLKNEAESVNREYFDKLYVGGKKLYCLEYTDDTGKKQIQKSCKGFSFIQNEDKGIFKDEAGKNKKCQIFKTSDSKYEELTYEHFSDERIKGRQFTMTCGRSRFLSETDNFNTYHDNYTKTITNMKIDSGFISPIRI